MKLPFIRWFFSLFQLMKSAQVHVDQSKPSTNSENIILISSFISSFFFLNQYKWLEYKFHEWNAQATQVKFHKRNQSISSYEYEFFLPSFLNELLIFRWMNWKTSKKSYNRLQIWMKETWFLFL